MSSVVISGDTSGAITLAAPAVSGTNTLTLPAVTGNVLTDKSTGVVLQVVQGTSTTIVSTTTSTNITSGITASITPKFSTSKVLILFSAIGYTNSAGGQITTYIYKNSSQLGSNFFGQQYAGSSVFEANVSFNYLDSPATTSATTYAIYFNNTTGVGTAYLPNSGAGTITLMEIAG